MRHLIPLVSSGFNLIGQQLDDEVYKGFCSHKGLLGLFSFWLQNITRVAKLSGIGGKRLSHFLPLRESRF
jgi:hypothetical protein